MKTWIFAGLFAGLILSAGCSQTRQSEPKRTAVEELLLSRAADKALSGADFQMLRGKKVFLSDKYMKATDQEYALGAMRDYMSIAGALLVDAAGDAEVIVEARSGGLSIDSGNSLVGIPEVPFPIPAAGTLVTPEAPLYKSDKQHSVAKLALLAYDAETRKHLFSTGALIGKSHHHYYRFLGFFDWTATDLPEKRL
ncbi:MAG: DUF6655 family protein [Limisphaerales bacterium]